MIKEAVKKLVKGIDLSSIEMKISMEEIMTGIATQAQIGAFLSLLNVKGETVNEITCAAEVMREKALKFHLSGDVIDTCSTGGTGINHFNISTTSAFVLAGAGVQVAKHGNRAISGKCGSADVLLELGVNIELEPLLVKESIEKIGLGFLFAPLFHKAMKYAAAARREIGIRSIFNILGPLTNPASATHQLLGVFDSSLTEILANVLGNLGIKRAMVVHGEGGLDEITLSGITKVSELKNNIVNNYELTPDDFGLPFYPIKKIKGGDKEENAQILQKVLASESGPERDVVVANCAAAFKILDMAANLKDGVRIAKESIDTGKAADKLKELIKLSNEN